MMWWPASCINGITMFSIKLNNEIVKKKQKTKNKIKGMIMKEESGKKRSQPEEIESKDRASFVVVFAQQSN